MTAHMDRIRSQLEAALAEAGTPDEVEALRVRFLGRSGEVTTLAKKTDFKAMSPEEKKAFGQGFNQLKQFAEQALAEAAAQAKARKTEATPVTARIDLTLPGTQARLGALHPITLVRLELEEIFRGLGFQTMSGSDMELEFNNFDALNIPVDHPAREMQDTFWLKNGRLLRTHTSAYQVQAIKKVGAPLRAIFPGRCFRYEELDASHENTFYQLEGLMVDQEVSVANLIAVMKILLSEVFRRDVTVRLRPGFFPFVEPGFELDLQCLICNGDGCSVCKRTGWVELIPCGLVHPAVLENGGLDPDRYSGFAFGLGLTRLAMMKFGIPDIRLLNAGDLRFNEQFTAGV